MPKLLIHTQPLGRQPRSRRDVGLMHRRTQATTTTPSIDLRSSEASWLKGCSRNSIRNKHRVCFPWRLCSLLPKGLECGGWATLCRWENKLAKGGSWFSQTTQRHYISAPRNFVSQQLCCRSSLRCIVNVSTVYVSSFTERAHSQVGSEKKRARHPVRRRSRTEGTSTYGEFIVQRGSCKGLAPH